MLSLETCTTKNTSREFFRLNENDPRLNHETKGRKTTGKDKYVGNINDIYYLEK